MAISVMQRSVGVDPNGVNGDVTATFASANTAGNAIIVCIAIADTTVTGEGLPTDTQGNTYTLIASFTNGTNFASEAWYACYNIASHASGNVVTSNPDLGAVNMHIWEVAGLAASAALDKSASTYVTTGTALSSGATSTTTVANELLLAVFCNNFTNDTWTLGSGWSNLSSSGAPQTNAFSSASEEQIVSATGAYTATVTVGHSGVGLSVIVTFKGATATVNKGAAFLMMMGA